jgi:hypothetical protein
MKNKQYHLENILSEQYHPSIFNASTLQRFQKSSLIIIRKAGETKSSGQRYL